MAFITFCGECASVEREEEKESSATVSTDIQPYKLPTYSQDPASLERAAVYFVDVKTEKVFIPRGEKPVVKIYFSFPKTEPKNPFGTPNLATEGGIQGKINYSDSPFAADWSWGYYISIGDYEVTLFDENDTKIDSPFVTNAIVIDKDSFKGTPSSYTIYRKSDLIEKEDRYYLPWHLIVTEEIPACSHNGLIRRARARLEVKKMLTSSQVNLLPIIQSINKKNVFDNLTKNEPGTRGTFQTTTHVYRVFYEENLFYEQSDYYSYLNGDTIFTVNLVTNVNTLSGGAPNGGISNFEFDPEVQGLANDLLNINFVTEPFYVGRGFFWKGSSVGDNYSYDPDTNTSSYESDRDALSYNGGPGFDVKGNWLPVVGEHRSSATIWLGGE